MLAICVAVVLCGCTASSAPSAEPAARPTTPAWWKEVHYQGLTLSVPQGWKVLDVQRSCHVAGPAVLLGGVMPLCPVPARQRGTLVRIYPLLQPGPGQGTATSELNGARVRMHGTTGGPYESPRVFWRLAYVAVPSRAGVGSGSWVASYSAGGR